MALRLEVVLKTNVLYRRGVLVIFGVCLFKFSTSVVHILKGGDWMESWKDIPGYERIISGK